MGVFLCVTLVGCVFVVGNVVGFCYLFMRQWAANFICSIYIFVEMLLAFSYWVRFMGVSWKEML